MKIKSKLNLDFEFEIQTNSKKKKNKKTKKTSFLKMSMVWVALEIISSLLDKLVTWIINTFTNGSFYFYNRIFLFERKVVYNG